MVRVLLNKCNVLSTLFKCSKQLGQLGRYLFIFITFTFQPVKINNMFSHFPWHYVFAEGFLGKWYVYLFYLTRTMTVSGKENNQFIAVRFKWQTQGSNRRVRHRFVCLHFHFVAFWRHVWSKHSSSICHESVAMLLATLFYVWPIITIYKSINT